MACGTQVMQAQRLVRRAVGVQATGPTMPFFQHSSTEEPKMLYNFQSSFYDARNLSPSAMQGFNANLSLLLWFQLT